MDDLEFGIDGVCHAVTVALALHPFRLVDQMDGETVSAWKTRRKQDRLWAQRIKAAAGRPIGGNAMPESVGVASGVLMRGHRSGVLTARDINAAERIYRLGQMARVCGGAVTAFYGERVGSGEVDYEHGVAAELAYRAVMDALPSAACREFIRMVIVEGEGMEVAAGRVMPSGLSTKQRKLGGAWVYLQLGLSTAVEHFDGVGWR